MFTILGAYLDPDTDVIIKSLLQKTNIEANFISISKKTESNFFLSNLKINLFLISMDDHPQKAIPLLDMIRNSQENHLTPTILFSKEKEMIAEGFFTIGCCNYFFLPLTEKDYPRLIELLNITYKVFKLFCSTQTKQDHFLYLESGSLTYNIPFRKILFIESIQHRCLVHTTEEVICVTKPLYKIKERCPEYFLMQCHRSFLINPSHVRYIDKALEPWCVHFKDYPQTACISRGYRKEFVQTYLGQPSI